MYKLYEKIDINGIKKFGNSYVLPLGEDPNDKPHKIQFHYEKNPHLEINNESFELKLDLRVTPILECTPHYILEHFARLRLNYFTQQELGNISFSGENYKIGFYSRNDEEFTECLQYNEIFLYLDVYITKDDNKEYSGNLLGDLSTLLHVSRPPYVIGEYEGYNINEIVFPFSAMSNFPDDLILSEYDTRSVFSPYNLNALVDELQNISQSIKQTMSVK